jgi:hypothetical protein
MVPAIRIALDNTTTEVIFLALDSHEDGNWEGGGISGRNPGTVGKISQALLS